MSKYQSFIFDSFGFHQQEGCIELRYSLDDQILFNETISMPLGFEYQAVPLAVLDRAFFALHLIGGTSYYKTYCPPNLVVNSGTLSKVHAKFWNKISEKGLLEFFYQNNINPKGKINFPSGEQSPLLKFDRPKSNNKLLVPIGGGKDSIVAAEILKKTGWDITLLRVGNHPIVSELTEAMNLPTLTVERTLSPKLFELNRQDAYNGHVPVTAYISCLSVVISLLYGFDMIVMSNERSAEEGNVEKWGKKINHQWSKSWEFEKLFSEYIKNFITTDLEYFSLLRHLSELAITKYFCTLPQYFTKFTSCNRNWKIIKDQPKERWCRECPKCASSFALFAAFLPKESLIEIFGGNMFKDSTLRILYKELLGLEGIKPFECVGTLDEMKTAFLLAHERGDLDSTPIMQMFLKESLPNIKDPEKLKKQSLEPGSTHAIPEEFLTVAHEDPTA
ncbi:endonuclease domain-containing protein [Patescibacteria group bacterium]|nr:endonuclease domain-containing protein [Patescibacteria group bacterium]MBU1124012.1 endonuclease domain-containing protein [Patescibacteria group bacterium]MBU1911234.1 endonuclease domain-containing protein [Patescibacteria group bacterium]